MVCLHAGILLLHGLVPGLHKARRCPPFLCVGLLSAPGLDSGSQTLLQTHAPLACPVSLFSTSPQRPRPTQTLVHTVSTNAVALIALVHFSIENFGSIFTNTSSEQRFLRLVPNSARGVCRGGSFRDVWEMRLSAGGPPDDLLLRLL